MGRQFRLNPYTVATVSGEGYLVFVWPEEPSGCATVIEETNCPAVKALVAGEPVDEDKMRLAIGDIAADELIDAKVVVLSDCVVDTESVVSRTDAFYLRNMSGAQVEAIRTTNVLIIGLGALGSIVAVTLAQCQFGSATIMDPDVVEASNLNRSSVWRREDVGNEKASVVAGLMAATNPGMFITALVEAANDPDSIVNIINTNKINIVVECADGPNVRETVRIACQRTRVPLVCGITSGFYSLLGPTLLPEAPAVPDIPPSGRVCGTMGSWAPIILQTASEVARECLRVVLQQKPKASNGVIIEHCFSGQSLLDSDESSMEGKSNTEDKECESSSLSFGPTAISLICNGLFVVVVLAIQPILIVGAPIVAAITAIIAARGRSVKVSFLNVVASMSVLVVWIALTGTVIGASPFAVLTVAMMVTSAMGLLSCAIAAAVEWALNHRKQ